MNKAVHEKLLKKKINHDFIIRPGGHTGRYWNNAIDYQILFSVSSLINRNNKMDKIVLSQELPAVSVPDALASLLHREQV